MDIVDSSAFGEVPVILHGGTKAGSQGVVDPSQPSAQARAQVNNRNNLADLTLKKTLEQQEKQRAASIAVIDHCKLECLEFLKSIKKCESDQDPTYLKLFQDLSLNSRRSSAPVGTRTDPEGRQRRHRRRQRSNSAQLEELSPRIEEETAQTISTSGPPPYRTRMCDPNEPIMAEVVEVKAQPKKEPLKNRIATFYEALQMYKQAQETETDDYLNGAMPGRQLRMLARGIDSLVEFSDGED